MKATVIISVYKNVRALEAILRSLKQQTEQDFELIISEDGECSEMASFMSEYAFPWPTRHLTQEDLGWRKNRALNAAVVAAQSEWLIFVDGDCVLHPRFVEMHVRNRAPHVVLAGKRVKLNEALSERVMRGQKIRLWPYLIHKRGCALVEEGFFVPIAKWLRRPVRHLTGSNMSMAKADLMAINGFDEHYTLPAIGEDLDIEWRLPANGCRIVSLRNLAVQYHLYHPENWVDDSVNMAYFNEKKRRNQIVCTHGIRTIQ